MRDTANANRERARQGPTEAQHRTSSRRAVEGCEELAPGHKMTHRCGRSCWWGAGMPVRGKRGKRGKRGGGTGWGEQAKGSSAARKSTSGQRRCLCIEPSFSVGFFGISPNDSSGACPRSPFRAVMQPERIGRANVGGRFFWPLVRPQALDCLVCKLQQ